MLPPIGGSGKGALRSPVLQLSKVHDLADGRCMKPQGGVFDFHPSRGHDNMAREGLTPPFSAY